MRTIEQKNRMIAEFMGVTADGTTRIIENKLTHFPLAEYHTSWDWLMPVVNLCVSRCKYSNQRDRITFALLSMNIEKMYNAVVQFIEWYNENK